MLDKIFGLFQAHAPTRVAALKDAVAAGDLPWVASEAHALKSPALNIGALRLAALCGEIEAGARSGDAGGLTVQAIERLEAEMGAVNAAIALAKSPGSPLTPRQQPWAAAV
jgi:HPt (histidine-containing phosphotransfer) domain-containing protein